MNESNRNDPSPITNHVRAGMNSWLQEAFEAYQTRQLERAERVLRLVSDGDPKAIEPRIHLANLFYAMERYQDAVDILEPVKADPAARDYLWFLFKARWHAGFLTAACQIIQTLNEREGTTSEQRRQFLECARQAGRFDLARQLARQLGDTRCRRELRGLEWMVHISRLAPVALRRPLFHWGVERYERQGRWQRLGLLLEAARLSDPGYFEWPLRLGKLCRQTRDVYDPHYSRERMYYRNALRCRPLEPEALRGLILTLHDMGFWVELVRCIDQHETVLDTPWARKMKAAGLVNLERYHEAAIIYTHLGEEAPDGFSRFCLGLIALQQNDWPIADELFEFRSSDRSLDILGLFFHHVSRRLAAGEPVETIDGQIVLDAIPPPDTKEPAVPPPPRLDSCFLCGWEGPREPLWRDRITSWIRVRCPRCSMISVAPLPDQEQINALYTTASRREHTLQRQYKASLDGLSQAREEDCRRLPLYQEITDWGDDFNWIAFEQSLGGDKRFLDAGCSAGYAVKVFQLCGWQAMGVDIDSDAAAYGQARGIDIRVGTVDDLDPVEFRFHLITVIDVIEHVANPAALIRQCHALLNPGGLLYLKTPCADSLPHRFIGEEWLDASEHLHFFSRTTLRRLLADSGFEIIGFKQTMEAPTPYLHRRLWKERFYPECLVRWIDRLRVGDTIRFLARKSR